ncbi:MAG TPA: DUF1080 domain-containing protein [Gemmataceae bacterium]|nr:DUF1080 domain-containing protein [Gemmataceae bacterium]
MRRAMLILVLSLPLCGLPGLRAADKEPPEGFDRLFNGKDLSGWQVNEKGDIDKWGAADGILFTKGGGGGWLMTEKEYADFELRLDFKVPKAGNSGVALRSALKGAPHLDAGMEIQILDDPWYLDEKNYKGLKQTQRTGSIYGVVPPAKDALKPAGEWNSFRIVAKGRKITVELNGSGIVDANLDDYKDQAKEHSGLLREKGHLGLQSHDGRVEFRNICVKPLVP